METRTRKIDRAIYDRVKKYLNDPRGFMGKEVAEFVGIAPSSVSRIGKSESYEDYIGANVKKTNVPTDEGYSIVFNFAEDKVNAYLYLDGQPIESGMGLILRDGTVGIAQASSYALKKIYEKLNGGKV